VAGTAGKAKGGLSLGAPSCCSTSARQDHDQEIRLDRFLGWFHARQRFAAALGGDAISLSGFLFAILGELPESG